MRSQQLSFSGIQSTSSVRSSFWNSSVTWHDISFVLCSAVPHTLLVLLSIAHLFPKIFLFWCSTLSLSTPCCFLVAALASLHPKPLHSVLDDNKRLLWVEWFRCQHLSMRRNSSQRVTIAGEDSWPYPTYKDFSWLIESIDGFHNTTVNDSRMVKSMLEQPAVHLVMFLLDHFLCRNKWLPHLLPCLIWNLVTGMAGQGMVVCKLTWLGAEDRQVRCHLVKMRLAHVGQHRTFCCSMHSARDERHWLWYGPGIVSGGYQTHREAERRREILSLNTNQCVLAAVLCIPGSSGSSSVRRTQTTCTGWVI